MLGTDRGADVGVVSVIIVNYNGGHLVPRAVEAVLGSAIPIEVIVLDNGSHDGSRELLHERYGADTRVLLIDNRANLGFAKAVNLGIERARGEFVLLLNPDCIVDAAAVAALVQAMRDYPGAGMAGGLVRNPDGGEQVGCRRRIPTPWRATVRALRLDVLLPGDHRFESPLLTREPLPPGPIPIEAISGAFMLIRRTLLDAVGLLDERYFLHVEDLDLCLRMRRAGYQVLFVPQSKALHYKSFCSGGRPYFVLWHKHLGMVRFYRKFFVEEQGRFIVTLATVGLWLHFAASVVSTAAGRLTRRLVGLRKRGSSAPLPSRMGATPTRKGLEPALQGGEESRYVTKLPPDETLSEQGWVPPSVDLAGRDVLVTGGSGFVGGHLVAALRGCDASVSVLEHCSVRWQHADRLRRLPGDLTQPESLRRVCSGVHTVFHLAGLAHVEPGRVPEASELHWRITVEGTRALLAEAVEAGVERFIFVSTVKAMGEGGDEQLDEASPEKPQSAYGRAKLAAEQLIRQTCDEHGIDWVVLRLPMVYGRDNKGNLPRMVRAADRGWFPPLPEVHNRRSIVHIDDVVQALLLSAVAPKAGVGVYIVTDGEVYSTREMLDLIREALGRPVLRWSLPLTLLKLMAKLGDMNGRLLHRPVPFDSSVSQKLLGSAWYSSEKIGRELGYRPTRTLRSTLPEIVAEYRRVHYPDATSVKGISTHQPQSGG